jgi:YebC/PmpR family DNA-binding regulatory protein
VDKAKGANMPKDTIEKAIKKGTGELEGESYEEALYEGYGPCGVAVMCKVVTDNRNRTGAEVKKIFERAGGSLGPANCVAFQFSQKGVVLVAAENASEDQIMEIALEAGADDVQSSPLIHEITCSTEAFQGVKQAIEAAEIEISSADLEMVAASEVTLDSTSARKVMRLIDGLEEHDDVDAVYSNSDIPDEVLAELASK